MAIIELGLLLFLISLSLTDAQGDTRKVPCKYFDGLGKDAWFAQQTLVDLYQKPSKFYGYKGVKNCNLKYIDFFDVEPIGDYLWIAYMGDSVLKEVFSSVAQR